MAQFNCKEDYLEQMIGEIRNRKAKCLIAEEIDQHIEDQKAFYMEEGDDDQIAMVKTLEQMGDPMEVGKQLDKIHRPRIEWYMLIVVFALCCIGILAQLSLARSINEVKFSYSVDVGRHILFLAVGFLLMITVYFVDYSIIGKYPILIWCSLFVGFFLCASFGTRVNGQLPYLYAYGMLFIPVYGGIIYANRKKGYVGIIKCLLFSISAVIIEQQFVAQSSVYLGLLLACMIMLSAAAIKNWFGTSKKKALVAIWGWIPITFSVLILFNSNIISSYQVERFKGFFEIIKNPELFEHGYQISVVNKVISHAKLFGGSSDFTIGYLPGLDSDYILTYVIGKWGLVAGVLIIGIFVTLIGECFIFPVIRKIHWECLWG